MSVQLAIYVDWDNDYSFSASDNIREDVIEFDFRNGMSKLWQDVADESICNITVRNDTGKYTPENTSSPLYGKLRPRHLVKVVAMVNGLEYVMWRGWIERIAPDWSPQGAYTGKTTALIECIGAKQRLEEADINLAIQENKRGDEIIALILQQVVLPPSTGVAWLLGVPGFSELGYSTVLAATTDYSDLEIGTRIFRYYGDVRDVEKSGGSNAYSMIRDVTVAERGRFFFSRDGKATWWNANHILDYVEPDAALGSQEVYKNTAMDYQHGQHISNMIQVTVYPREEGSTGTLWKLDKEMTIMPNEIKEFEAPFTDSSGRRAGAVDGTISVAVETYSSGTANVTLEQFSERATVNIYNAGAIPAVLTELEIEGQVLKSQNQMVLRQEDADSILLFGKRGELKLNLKALDNLNDAEDIANVELLRRRDEQGIIGSVTLLNENNGVANLHHFEWQIGTRLALEYPELGHEQEYIIVGERHSFSDGGKAHQTTFYIEPLILKRMAYHSRFSADTDLGLKDASARSKLAQTFEVEYTKALKMVRVWLRKEGNPSGNLTLSLYATDYIDTGWELGVSTLGIGTTLNSSMPDVDSLLETSSDVFTSNDVDGAFKPVIFRFGGTTTLTPGTTYALVLESSGSVDGSNYFVMWVDDASGTTDTFLERYDGSVWVEEDKDAAFEVYGT